MALQDRIVASSLRALAHELLAGSALIFLTSLGLDRIPLPYGTAVARVITRHHFPNIEETF